ncbi:MAG TPA: cation diffusion facilitator family transporter [Methanothrix sp.]|nr:cation diffusion facilitator family transporter [Methanothrix sp.]
MAYYETVRRILIIIFLINIATALVKGGYGLLTGSLSMSADGVHSLFDGTSNIIGLVGISLASRPADKEYPYGHAKFETFASLGIAMLLFISAIELALAAAERLQSQSTPQITEMSFAVMGITMLINIGVSAYEYILGRRLRSSILVADSLHTRSDILASFGVILGLLAVEMGYPQADPVIALLICALILMTGIEIVRDSSQVLLDKALLDERQIIDLAESVDGVCTCHGVRTRGTTGEIFVDLHIGVDSSLSIDVAHKVGEDVESMIKSRIPRVRDVVVHLEPKDYCELNAARKPAINRQ